MLIKAYHYGSKSPLPKIIALSPFKNKYSNEIRSYFQDYGYLGENVVKNLILNIDLDDKSHTKRFTNIGFLETQFTL